MDGYGRDQEQMPEVFENDIEVYLTEFCREQGIEDMKKESQSVWNAALMYIKRHVFNVPGILKSSNNINNNSGVINTNYNAYDYDKVNSVCDYYIYLCMKNDKEVSINGFTFLTGISDTVIYEWGTEGSRKLSTAGSVIYEKLSKYREESLSAKLATANKNPVGILAILNRHYQWNMPGVSREQRQIQSRSPEQIAAEYGQIEDKKGMPELPE